MTGKKGFLLAGIALLACGVTIAAMAMVIHRQRNTIDHIRTEMDTEGIPYDENLVPKEFPPAEVHHFYERLGQKIYLSDDTFGQIWLPVLADVPLSTHPLEQLQELPSGRMISHNDKGQVNALTGIDISAHNDITDWHAIKEDGIDFVMLRVGYRGYGKETGTVKTDDRFREYYRKAKDVGLLVGAYFFSQAITEEEAVEEAIATVKHLDGCELDFPVAFDWELYFDLDNTRTENVPVDVLTDCVLAFCQNVEAYGYQPMVYQNKRTTLFKLDLPRLQGIPFWLAEYGDGATYIYDYDMWQYSCKGTVAGINGKVDMNLCFKDFSKEGAPDVALPDTES